MTALVGFGCRGIIIRAKSLDWSLGGRSRRRNELTCFVDVDGATDRQSTICRGISINLLKSATHDTLGDGVSEAELTGAARSWLAVLRVGEVSATDPFNVANLVVR